MTNEKLGNLVKEIRIPGRHAGAFEMLRGQFLQIIDMNGGQFADFIGFNTNDHDEKLSPTHTRTSRISG